MADELTQIKNEIQATKDKLKNAEENGASEARLISLENLLASQNNRQDTIEHRLAQAGGAGVRNGAIIEKSEDAPSSMVHLFTQSLAEDVENDQTSLSTQFAAIKTDMAAKKGVVLALPSLSTNHRLEYLVAVHKCTAALSQQNTVLSNFYALQASRALDAFIAFPTMMCENNCLLAKKFQQKGLRVLVLLHGRVAEEGFHDELLKRSHSALNNIKEKLSGAFIEQASPRKANGARVGTCTGTLMGRV
eukprot:gene35227-43440_t